MATAACRLFGKDREVSPCDGAPDCTELQCEGTAVPSESLWVQAGKGRDAGSVTDTQEEVVAEAVHNQLGKSRKPSSSPGF